MGFERQELREIRAELEKAISRHQAKFLIKILRTKLVRKKLADDLEKWVKGKEEPDLGSEWLG